MAVHVAVCEQVHREGKDPRWAFDDERAVYAAENKLAHKMAVAHAMHELGSRVELPARKLSFLSLLLPDSSDEM